MTPDRAGTGSGACPVCGGSCIGFPRNVPDPFLEGSHLMAKTSSTTDSVKTTVANERLFDTDGVLRYATGDTIRPDDDTKLYTEAELAKKTDASQ